MICANCQQRDACDHASKDSPILAGCDDREGTWLFDRIRLERMTADRDRLAAELERVRTKHLRNQLKRAELHARVHTQIAKQGPMSSRPKSPKTLRRAARNRDRWRKVVDALRAALAQPQDGTKAKEARRSDAGRVEVPEFSRKLTEADMTKWLRVDKRWEAFVHGFHTALRRLDEAVERSRLSDAGRVWVEPSEIDAAWNEYATRYPDMLSDDPDDDLEIFSAGFRAGATRSSRSDAGRVEVPELTDADLPNGGSDHPDSPRGYVDYGFRRGWEELAKRILLRQEIRDRKRRTDRGEG